MNTTVFMRLFRTWQTETAMPPVHPYTQRKPFLFAFLVSVIFEREGRNHTLQNKLNEIICCVIVKT